MLDGYASDEIMLDSFLQWAGNPTSMSASYGLEENDHYALKNLEVRQGLSLQEAEERVGELRKVCGSLIDWTRRLPIESRRQIWEIQRAPRGGLHQRTGRGAPARSTRSYRSEETRYTLVIG